MSSESRRFAIEVSPHAERDIAKLSGAIARLILEEIRARRSTEPNSGNQDTDQAAYRILTAALPHKGRRLSSVLSSRPAARHHPRRLPQKRQRSLAKAAGVTGGQTDNALPAMSPYW